MHESRLLHSKNRNFSVAPEVGRRSDGCAGPAARADGTAAPIWPHGIGCPQRRDCESGLSTGGYPPRQVQRNMSDYLRSALGYLNGGTGGNEYVGQTLDINSVKLRVTRLIAEGESIISPAGTDLGLSDLVSAAPPTRD